MLVFCPSSCAGRKTTGSAHQSPGSGETHRRRLELGLTPCQGKREFRMSHPGWQVLPPKGTPFPSAQMHLPGQAGLHPIAYGAARTCNSAAGQKVATGSEAQKPCAEPWEPVPSFLMALLG